ncbi:transposon DNA-invertase Bin3 domain protein [Staphylococcus epidermidis VCU129]|nr:transposon DNA-invertase Bin3 domain protein [Staphylococcus epidermidis VCU129]
MKINVGYVRVLSMDQNLKRQLDNLKTFGAKNIYRKTV